MSMSGRSVLQGKRRVELPRLGQQRGNLRVLAFQAFNQGCGFLPDSTAFANDKANVRDGHYPLWGPLHFFTPLSNGGAPSPAAGAFVLRFSQPKLDQALVQAIAKTGNVPACAMHVKRTTELGDLVKADPPYSCDCFFDFVVNGKTSCQTCTTSAVESDSLISCARWTRRPNVFRSSGSSFTSSSSA